MWRGLTPVQPLLEVGARSWLNLRSPIERQKHALLKLHALLVIALSRLHLRVKYWVTAPRLQRRLRARSPSRPRAAAVSVGVGDVEK